jgi:methylenetetrahydrofolate reductase (NADPH)
MATFQNILNTSGFKIGVELVSTRGIIAQQKSQKLIAFGEQLCRQNDLDWISITDNAGGFPAISPTVIGKSLQSKGKEIIIHMTCKDYNRNGLESKAWELSSDGFLDILAITGDYPAAGIKGAAKPVFDIDSIGLLHTLNQLNEGLEVGKKKKTQLKKTNFYLGAVVSNFKKNENELIPQYLKLLKKIEMGAKFIINQVGYDAVKMSELISFQKYKNLEHIHMIGNVFVLSKFTVNLFYQHKIPGIVLTDALYKKCQAALNSSDKGKQFFLELAAKMLAVYKGLGYKGGYLGGVHNIEDYKRIMNIFASYGNDDWKQFVLELQFSQQDEFFMFKKDTATGLTTNTLNPVLLEKRKRTKHVNLKYSISKRFHKILFEEGKGLYNTGKSLCKKSNSKLNAPKWLYTLEQTGKKFLFDCQDCGDCSLQEIAYLCPESQCAKNQRNGPCGGTLDTKCEVKDIDCIWARAYDRTKYDGDVWKLLEHVPTIRNHDLTGTSSWGNFWLEKDHCAN